MTSVSGEVVGRTQERAAVAAWLDEVCAQTEGARTRLSLALLTGDAGIGKTTLWAHGCDLAGERGLRVLTTRPGEPDSELALAGIGDLLELVVDDVRPHLPAPQAAALDVALLRAPPLGEAPDRRAVAVAVLSALRILAEDAPVVVGIDDLQWLDPSSAAALTFALRRLWDAPIGVLATLRVETEPPLDVVATFPRRHHLPLGPLRLDELQALLSSRLGSSLRLPALRRLHGLSGGNPFVALEVAALNDPDQWPEAKEPPTPEPLVRVARQRIGALPSHVQRVLRTAALLAVPTTEVLEAASGASVHASLHVAAAAGIVEFAGNRVRFTHPLLRAAAAPIGGTRVWYQLHRRLAAVVADPEEKARHLAMGSSEPDAAAALVVAEAATRARNRGAPEAAAELAELALSLDPDDEGTAVERTLAAAAHHVDAGNPWRADALLTDVAERLSPGPTRARAHARLGQVQYLTGRVIDARATLEGALTEAGNDGALRAEIAVELVPPLLLAGDIPAAVAYAEEAVRGARETGAKPVEAEALAFAVLSAFFSGQGLRSDLVDRARALETHGVRVRADAHPRAMLALVQLYADDLTQARGNFEYARELAMAHGDAIALHDLANGLSELELRAGNWECAAALAEEALQSAREVGAEGAVPLIRFRRALVWAHRGDLVGAESEASDALQQAAASGMHAVVSLCLWALGFLALSRGDHAAAHGHMAPLAEAIKAMGVGEPGVVRFVPDEVEALVALGDLTAAEALLAPFEAQAHAVGRAWALATSARCRGLLAAAKGDLHAGIALLGEAREHHTRFEEPFELARTLLVSGSIGRRGRQKRVPRAMLEQALELFTSLGAPVWSDRTRAELTRVGGRPSSPCQLTATEQQVVDMVVAGATNQEVADTLFMSVRTVETNLSRIYRKLGIRSRTQLAAIVAGRTPKGVDSSDSPANAAP